MSSCGLSEISQAYSSHGLDAWLVMHTGSENDAGQIRLNVGSHFQLQSAYILDRLWAWGYIEYFGSSLSNATWRDGGRRYGTDHDGTILKFRICHMVHFWRSIVLYAGR